MRMWMLPPERMCRKHLLGEHVEIHMAAGSVLRKKTLTGFLEQGLLELHNLHKRHSELVKEMKRRGYNHASPLPKLPRLRGGRIDRKQNIADLTGRCTECKKLWK